MYEQHFNLNQLPFSIAPDPSFLYLSGAHREALAHLMYGFSHGGFVMVTGEVGTGKTTLLRNLVKQTPPDLDVAFILNPRLTVRELLASLCDELGIAYNPDSTTSVKQYIDLITRHLLETHRSGRSTVMIIDEAQNLSPAVLEQVRLLTNLETDDRKLLRIILIGQPELKEMLERQDLRQLAQRITARYHLGSLNREDTYAYIMHRMSRAGGNPQAFSSAALRRIYSLSKGTPRLINVIADRSLLGAYTLGKHQVTAGIVSRAAREVLGHNPSRRAWWVGGATALFAAGAAWAILSPFAQDRPPAEPAPGNGEPTTSASTSPAEPRQTEAGSTAAPTPTPVLAEAVSAAPGPAVVPEANKIRQEPAIEQTPEAMVDLVETNPLREEAGSSSAAGDEIITPETYALMQANARSQPEPAPTLNPQAVPDAGSARPAANIDRPAGGYLRNQQHAYAAVFERWGVAYDDIGSEQIPCDFAPSAGLQCLSERGSWIQIAQMNLPVVLELWDGQPAPFHAALLAMDEGRILLGIGDQTVQTTQRALRDQWAGSYVVLWQTPPGYYGSLRAGQQHETVGWLRLQLASLVDRSLTSSTPDVFDEKLQQAVLDFQAAEGLTTDGIVGPATWIRLATRLNLPQPSLAG